MDTTEKFIVPCYIGETKTKAGIFLSAKIARRKPYGRYLKLKEYVDFAEAEKVFWAKYKSVIAEEKVRLNCLYSVREEELYSVFSTPYYVGVVYTSCALEEAKKLVPNFAEQMWWRHNLTYKEAQWIASERFAKYWKNPNLNIQFGIRVHSVITLEEVKRQNRFI